MKKNNIKINVLYNTLYQILILIIPFITTPYISRILLADGIGIYSKTTALVKYFWLFALLGMANYGNREIAKKRDNKEELSSEFWNLFAFQAITSVICTFLFIGYICFVCPKNEMIFYLCQIPYMLSAIFEISWFFYGLEEFKLMVIRNAIIKVLTAICIFTFVKNVQDTWKYILINTSSLLLGQMCLWPILIKNVNKPHDLNVNEIRKHLKPNLILFVSVLAVSLYTIMDKIMLGIFCSNSEVGYYENAEKLMTICNSIVGSIGAVMLPRISFLIEKKDNKQISVYMEKSMRYIMILAIAISFGLAGVGNEFSILFFGEDFKKCGTLIVALTPAIIFYSWSNILRTQYLLPAKKDKVFVKGTIWAAAVNLIFNYILIKKIGALGAVIATVGAQFAEAAYQTVKIRKEIPVRDYIIGNIPFIVFGVAIFVICRILAYMFGTKIYTIFLQILIGGGLYLTISIIYLYIKRDNFIVDGVEKVNYIFAKYKKNKAN